MNRFCIEIFHELIVCSGYFHRFDMSHDRYIFVKPRLLETAALDFPVNTRCEDGKSRDENKIEQIPDQRRRNGQSRRAADAREALLQLEETVSENARKACEKAQ